MVDFLWFYAPPPYCLGGGRRAAAAGEWGSSEEAPDVCFLGAPSLWFFRNARATIAFAKKAVLTEIQNRRDPHPQPSPKTRGEGVK